MELLAGWNRVRRNLVGTFFLQAKAEILENEIHQPEGIILDRQTYCLPWTQLEQEYRELAIWDSLLEEARQDYADKQKEFELRWHLCSEKNELLSKFTGSFESYYAVSKQKQKADKKINEQYDFELYEKVREVSRLKKQLARMKLLKVELEERLANSEIYREFMNSVVQQSNEEFENIPQVMSRYNELKDIRENYVEKTVRQVEMAFELEKELQEIVQLKEAENAAGKTYLCQLDDYKKDLQISNWRKSDNIVAIKFGLKREILMTYFPNTAIYNLYLLLCNQMKQPVTLQEHQFREQLVFIQKFLKELVKICVRTKEFLECPSDVPLASVKSEKKGKTSKVNFKKPTN